jgi:hypothetical protein
MDALRRIAGSIFLSLPAWALGFFAAAHFSDGLATDAAIPVPVYMIAQIAMPKAAYEDAAAALARADARNGAAAIARAEAGLRSGASPAAQVPILIHGLLQEPSSARGWTLLSEARLPTDKKNAARALSQALVLAPREYWLVEARVHDAALLWKYLDAETQARALEQTRMLWQEPVLRGQLRRLLFAQEGVDLVARAFAGRQDEVREMNRWLSAERRHAPMTERSSP